MRLEPWQGLEP